MSPPLVADTGGLPGTRADYRGAHPARPALVVEVAESSLAFDRREKGGLYARAGIAEYWIVNLVGHVLAVHREPAPDEAAAYGWRYRSVLALTPPAVITPLGLPASPIAVAALLP